MLSASLLPTDVPAGASSAASFPSVVGVVRNFARASATAAEIDSLRRDANLLKARNLPASLLKHADEQAGDAVAAVVRAIGESGRSTDDYASWSVLGIPRYPGRILAGASIRRFFDEGIRGISPHIIPQSSTHSLSGLISVGLGMGGPNLGAGGGRR
ncbi:MAG: hypothetical protein KY475_14070, partial [Planctomycetes bacterium]|nr:hypothetical protein [Planctomycetota bacterium]